MSARQPHPGRHYTLHLDVEAPQTEAASTWLWEVGAQGIEERDATTLLGPEAAGYVTLIGYFSEVTAAREAAEAAPRRWRARWTEQTGEDWRHAWKAWFRPTRIGHRLVIRPPWEPVQLLAEEVEVVVEPGLAFGSGTHETTRLVLREVDRLVQHPLAVLDVGCGSGILAIAAVRLGATRALGIDVDPEAVRTSRDNARRNQVASRCRFSRTPLARLRHRWPLILANIQLEHLLPLAPLLPCRLQPGGWLVLGGVLVPEREEAVRAFEGLEGGGGRLRLLYTTREGTWTTLVFRLLDT